MPGASARDSGRVDKSPPPPVVERPGGAPPSPDARWVDGYWDWDPASNDFLWVSGIWRVPPPGTFWIKGYWRRDDRGWYRVPGFWCLPKGVTPAGPAVSSTSTVVTPTPTTRVVARPSFTFPGPANASTLTSLSPLPSSSTSTSTSSLPLPLPLPTPTPTPGPSATTIPPVVASTSPFVSPTLTPAQSQPQPQTQIPTTYTTPSLVTLADQLAGQAAAFEQIFGRTAGITPQGGAFLADARRLRGNAFGLRQAIAAGDANGSFAVFRDIDSTWRRMADRVNWISPGRTGPNIQQIWRMGNTVAEMSRAMR